MLQVDDMDAVLQLLVRENGGAGRNTMDGHARGLQALLQHAGLEGRGPRANRGIQGFAILTASRGRGEAAIFGPTLRGHAAEGSLRLLRRRRQRNPAIRADARVNSARRVFAKRVAHPCLDSSVHRLLEDPRPIT
jgi:hypothetical protein